MASVDANTQIPEHSLNRAIVLTITRKLEFDAGHRIPDHRSQCRNLHGHRYVIEITLTGQVVDTEGAAERGMVMDFADVKSLAMEHLVGKWDHAFLVYEGDKRVCEFLDSIPDHKTVVLDNIPTVENLAALAFDTLARVYDAHYGIDLRLTRLRLYETPNCWGRRRTDVAFDRSPERRLSRYDGTYYDMMTGSAARACRKAAIPREGP